MSANGNQMQQVPSWILAMREAAQKAIQPADLEMIVKNQVEKAKAGDQAAIKFVFEQVLGGAALKGATFVQNVYGDQPAGAQSKPTLPRQAEIVSTRGGHMPRATGVEDRANDILHQDRGPTQYMCDACGDDYPAMPGGFDPHHRCKCGSTRWVAKSSRPLKV